MQSSTRAASRRVSSQSPSSSRSESRVTSPATNIAVNNIRQENTNQNIDQAVSVIPQTNDIPVDIPVGQNGEIIQSQQTNVQSAILTDPSNNDMNNNNALQSTQDPQISSPTRKTAPKTATKASTSRSSAPQSKIITTTQTPASLNQADSIMQRSSGFSASCSNVKTYYSLELYYPKDVPYCVSYLKNMEQQCKKYLDTWTILTNNKISNVTYTKFDKFNTQNNKFDASIQQRMDMMGVGQLPALVFIKNVQISICPGNVLTNETGNVYGGNISNLVEVNTFIESNLA